MSSRVRATIIASLAALSAIQAADIEGTIIIKRKLSKRTITASASSYARGAAVQLEADPDQDPLDFEREHVVVFLEGSLPSRPETAIIEQKNRRFAPDLLVVSAGSKVSFPNEDTIFHNVFSLSKPKSFDLGNYPKGQTRLLTFSEPGLVFVNCHLHPNMGAVIFVTPNRWSARADAAGRFRLTDVPPGSYTIVAWHKAVGFFRQKVRVDNKNVSGVEFFIPFENNMSAHNDQR